MEAPPLEVLQPAVQVVRKGNLFYLVMSTDQGVSDESTTDELKDLHHSVFSSSFINEEEEQDTPCLSPTDQSLIESQGHRPGLSQSQSSVQRHVIKNVDEIFNTMEELMKKLQHLRDIEADHHKLLKKLRKPLPVDKMSSDGVHKSPTAARLSSLDRGAGDGKEGVSTEPAQPQIQSTGF